MKLAYKLAILMLLFTGCIGAALWQSYDQQRLREKASPSQLWEVVWNQVAAVRASDYPGAYQQVSLSFRERYDLNAFVDLARNEYPALGGAERVEFGAVQWDGRFAILPTYFFLPDGEVVPCVYCLVFEGNAWKIDALRVQRRWPAGRRLGGMRA